MSKTLNQVLSEHVGELASYDISSAFSFNELQMMERRLSALKGDLDCKALMTKHNESVLPKAPIVDIYGVIP